jgi:hypothetical protein
MRRQQRVKALHGLPKRLDLVALLVQHLGHLPGVAINLQNIVERRADLGRQRARLRQALDQLFQARKDRLDCRVGSVHSSLLR